MKNKKKIPDLYLEQFILGELDEIKAKDIRERLANDPAIKKRLDVIRESNVKFESDKYHLSDKTEIYSRAIGQLVDQEKRKTIPWQFTSVSAFFILVLLIVPFIDQFSFVAESERIIFGEENNIRLKGIEPALYIYRKHDDLVEPVFDHQIVRKNDVLQIGYQGAGYQYGLIFSIDGRGEVTLHFPNDFNESNEIQPQGEIALPYAYQLDDAPNFERFFLITSHNKFDIGEIVARGKQIKLSQMTAGNVLIELPDDSYQTSILLAKVKK